MLQAMRRLFLFSFLFVVAAGIPSCGMFTPGSGSFERPPEEQPGAQSSDLDADIRMMWSVVAPDPGEKWVKASDAAVHASNRVFNTVKLEGLTRTQVRRKLRFDLRSKEYGYISPFWPVKRGVFPVRIDNGFYGWQFNLYFDETGRVREVKKVWIH